MKNKRFLPGCIVVILFATSTPAYADWQDVLNQWFGKASDAETSSASALDIPNQTDMNKAVLEALSVGIKRAIALLGRKDGYFLDTQVRIPIPRDLQRLEKLLRKFGQDKYADRFIKSMNRAAEQAAPQTSRIFLDAIRNMSVRDARKILQGSDDAATQYFRQHTAKNLRALIRPLVSNAMNNVGVTKNYKKLVSKADFVGRYLQPETLDLDAYVTGLAVEGLFIKLAEEEAKIRKDPAARTTELLKRVFGYF